FAVMDASFRMGSMGSVVGEKIARAIENARKESIPFVIFTASGGARMQEGVLSLMQMAKTSIAIERFSSAGGLMISVMTYPTTREKLPDDFQTAEFLFKHGQLDQIIHRYEMKETLSKILKMHNWNQALNDKSSESTFVSVEGGKTV